MRFSPLIFAARTRIMESHAETPQGTQYNALPRGIGTDAYTTRGESAQGNGQGHQKRRQGC